MGFQKYTSIYEKMDRSFYLGDDVVLIAKQLLGKRLVTCLNDKITAGKIVDTEAYCGRSDKACHAYKKRTPRTEIMYKEGGHAYVYLCYGIHHLFNVVTNTEALADAVLIRALEPIEGIDVMKKRRDRPNLSSGPGVLSKAMGIDIEMNGVDLLGDKVWISPADPTDNFRILSGERIGVEYAGEDARLPWRFVIEGNRFVSKPIKKSGNHPGLLIH